MNYILIQRYDTVVEFIFNRPQALNAHNTEMNVFLYDHLLEFQEDQSVEQILISSNHPRAFCAGGDILALRNWVLESNYDAAANFFYTEYKLDLLLHSYPKPIISIVDGIAFGGGMGIAIHPRYTIATDKAVFAMPETAIGLYPDAGASYFLPQLPYPLARYMALTGAKLTGAQAKAYGLTQYYVPSDVLPEILLQLRGGNPIIEAFATYSNQPSLTTMAAPMNPKLEELFSLPLEQLFVAIRDTPYADIFDQRSPTSLVIADELLSIASNTTEDLQQRLNREYYLSTQMIRLPDFNEGVRALLVDKDHDPHFVPQLTPAHISEIFLTAHDGPDIIF